MGPDNSKLNSRNNSLNNLPGESRNSLLTSKNMKWYLRQDRDCDRRSEPQRPSRLSSPQRLQRQAPVPRTSWEEVCRDRC